MKWIFCITGIDMKNVISIDLNLLVAFNAIYLERNVTKAGDRIGLAQPSMSNALSRLRALFDDELFIRTSEGMIPTPAAVVIAEHVQDALVAAQNAVNIAKDFDPGTEVADIKLITNQYVETVFIPPIVKKLRQLAPGVRLITQSVGLENYTPPLERGIVDFAIAAFPKPSKNMRHCELIKDHPVCLARKNHPLIKNNLSLATFLSCQHVSIAQDGNPSGPIDKALENKGLKREISASVSSFSTLPYLVAGTDLIAVVPKSFANTLSEVMPLDIHKLPLERPSFALNLIWGRSLEKSALHNWFKDLTKQVASEFEVF